MHRGGSRLQLSVEQVEQSSKAARKALLGPVAFGEKTRPIHLLSELRGEHRIMFIDEANTL